MWFFHDDFNTTGVTDKYSEDIFKQTPSNIKYLLFDKIKGGRVFLCFPLLLDISSIDMYLLDGVDIRIRLELAN